MAYSQALSRPVDAPVVSAFGPDDVRCSVRRFFAYFVDGLLVGALFIGISIAAGWWQTSTVYVTNQVGQQVAVPHLQYNGGLGAQVFATVLSLSYFIVMEWAVGWTIGKLLFGLRVVDFTGGQISFTQALIRNLLLIVDALFGCLVALIAMLTSDRRQRVGDRAAGTLVVHT